MSLTGHELCGKTRRGGKAEPEDEEVKVELMHLCNKKIYLKEFRHLLRMLPVRLPGEEFYVSPARRTPRHRPRTCWRNYTSHVAVEHLDNLQERPAPETNGMVWTA